MFLRGYHGGFQKRQGEITTKWGIVTHLMIYVRNSMGNPWNEMDFVSSYQHGKWQKRFS